MLTAVQLARLDVPPWSTENQGAAGPLCFWHDSNTSASVLIQWVETAQGIARVYERQADLGYFLPMPSIDGKPVIAYDSNDRRPAGHCGVDVGVNGELVIKVSIHQPRDEIGSADPCQLAHDTARMALTTLGAN